MWTDLFYSPLTRHGNIFLMYPVSSWEVGCCPSSPSAGTCLCFSERRVFTRGYSLRGKLCLYSPLQAEDLSPLGLRELGIGTFRAGRDKFISVKGSGGQASWQCLLSYFRSRVKASQ